MKNKNGKRNLKDRMDDKARAHQTILQMSETYAEVRKPLRIIAVDMRTGEQWG